MKRVYITAIILLVLISIAVLWWINASSPVNSKNKTAIIFTVKPGQGLKAISKNLKDQGLIRDQVAFFLLTKQLGIDSKIQAGDFNLNQSMNAKEIANGLTHGTQDIWVTVPEGQRAYEIAETLREKMPNYQPGWDDVLATNEGYLFPDTYSFPKDAEISTIVKIMRDNFESKFNTLDTSKTKLSKAEIINIASLIEREARHDEDRPIVSSVIQNRLGLGMKLDLDATIQYALGYQAGEKRWWKSALSFDDLKLNSNYNTYKVNGLPPTPISNPGIESLRAAISPVKSDYLYYFTDGNGINHYAKSLEEQNANISKFGL